MARSCFFFFLNKESGPCTRVLGIGTHEKKRERSAFGFGAEKGFIWVVGREKGGNTAPTHALETNMEACADAEEGKKGTSASFFLIG